MFACLTGSCLVLKGNGADVAQHCVPPVSSRRISITLRRYGSKLSSGQLLYSMSTLALVVEITSHQCMHIAALLTWLVPNRRLPMCLQDG